MGLPEADAKEGALRAVAKVLDATQTPYAVIGGVAVQIYSQEPRTTLDVDLAIARFDPPRSQLVVLINDASICSTSSPSRRTTPTPRTPCRCSESASSNFPRSC